ncbi:hypothetical protein LguiA_027910 [Lonicera macranthoides]
MADFTSADSFKNPFSFFDMDQNMELMSQFAEIHPSALDISNFNVQSFMGCSSISNDSFFIRQVPDFQENLAGNFSGIFHHDEKNVLPPPAPHDENGFHESKKRNLMDEAENSSGNSSPIVSENGIPRKNSSRGKKMKRTENEEEKPKDVVHVRARRGQATDSHSLAERVRRGKINEKLRCLQDIVPGCYKTMGMAVMLDEIIHYVQSLQNQVEFLSMKLTAASSFYDFNTETCSVTETIQREKGHELQRVIRGGGGGYEEVATTQIGPLDFNFGTYPSLPYHT